MEGTNDDNGAMPPIGQLTLERTCMEDIGRQLVNMEYIQQAMKQQIERSQSNHDWKTATDLTSILPNLEDLQSSLRKAFDAHARPLIRKLHIFHLPDELLMKIFEEVKCSFTRMWDNYPTTDTEDIKSLRLTCRRFCNASSHLLLDSLDVSLTYSSLKHLDEVSRHPVISKGIRSLRINAALYSPVPTSSLHDFIDQVFGILQEDNRTSFDRMQRYLGDLDTSPNGWGSSRSPNGWGSSPETPETHNSICENVRTLRTRNEVLLSCVNYLRDEGFDHGQDQHMTALCQVFRQYSQLYIDQTALLQKNTFARSVAEAAARLPKSTELEITDSDDCESFPFSNELLVPVYASVRSQLLRTSDWDPGMVAILPETPTKLLYQLPEAFFEAGVPLTQLSISLNSDIGNDLGLCETQAEDLVTIGGNLEVLKIDCHFTMQDSSIKDARGPQVSSSRFASLLSNSTKLRSVTLRLDEWMTLVPSTDLNAGPLLASLPWASLGHITLEAVYVHGDELSKHLDKVSPGTYICLHRVHLLTGLWADLLDVIRAKTDGKSEVTNPKSNQGEYLDSAFNLHWNAPDPNPGNAYIRGLIPENPLRSPPAQDITHDGTNQGPSNEW